MGKWLDVMMSEAAGHVVSVQGGGIWNEAARLALAEGLRRGDGPDALEFRAVVYRTGPNRNHVRFRESEMQRFAKSFEGKPFLRNHDTADIGSRDGMVIRSEMMGERMVQTIRLTRKRAMEEFAEGVIDRFSISWHFSGVTCSVCGEDWLVCEHVLGRRYDLGMSGREGVCELVFEEPEGKEVSAVNVPAVEGTGLLAELSQLKAREAMMDELMDAVETSKGMAEETGGAYVQSELSALIAEMRELKDAVEASKGMVKETGGELVESELSALVAEMRELAAQNEAAAVENLVAQSGLSASGQAVVRLAMRGKAREEVGGLIEAQRAAEAALAQRNVVQGIRPVTAAMMTTPEDRVQSALNWLFGAVDEAVPAPGMRSIRELYQAITGDSEWRGVFNPEYAQLAASTTTLAGMVVNALNKVVRMHYDNLATYRWFETVVDVVPHDGTTQNVQLIMVDGMATLPNVGEGAAYTEAAVGDSKEVMSFTKRGHYVGITLEAIRRSDILRIQAIPREMVKSAVRTRSAAIAGIFTANAGVGPTLADDSTALFHTNHGNLGSAAFAAAEWKVARQRIWGQAIPGTGLPLGLWPTYALVPIELYDTALEAFGYGSGDVGKPNTAGTAQTVNPYGASRLGDPRPIPIAVPEWTDADDWAYMVDPRLHSVIHMAYANAPQGGGHPLPEIFEVASETGGLMFTNDTLPVKVRDWWGYGVSTYVGIGKNNVT